MSKDRQMVKDKKKAPAPNVNKKESSYQSDKKSTSSAGSVTGKKDK
jgi:hypothetical protein